MGIHRSTARYRSQPRADEAAAVALMREYAHEQPMYGYRIIAAMLRHEGFRLNRKRVDRIWRQEGLQLPRRKTGKRRFGDSTGTLRRASRPNEVWTYDLLEARIEQWRQEYNHRRPHSSLRYLAPAVFAEQARLSLNVDWTLGAGQDGTRALFSGQAQ
ncbi:MAG: IS3 family transposase [Anaerolineae bacterium]|nr:IS3 family transposase [Anaerolineae bacterium]